MNISPLNPNALPISTGNYRDTMIGRILQDLGKISAEEAERILQLQKKEGLRFGDAARKLRLVSEADILQALAIQFDYPYLAPDQGELSKELVAAYEPFSPEVEALRALRSQLQLRWFNHGNKALSVISANAGEGCSNLAANLAIVFSQLGEHTLLIDANLRRPTQHALFNLRETRGLSDVLIGRASIEVIREIDAISNLSVLGAGTIPPNPQELLNRKSFTELINIVRDIYDVVIVDTAPAIAAADAQMVAARCRGALLVSRLNETPMSDIANVGDQLVVSDVQLVAAIVL
ncbi:MAG TPA: chain length determinant protein tyrosine kinase EpsG [Methylophilaceae bacterium]|jgi:protein-tyrosine kinase|nr:chain length determinant protein tyrosine kinase EpsG [Methylophilaceae bacterium]